MHAQVVQTIINGLGQLPSPSPAILGVWAALWVAVLGYHFTVREPVVRSRTNRALDKVLAAGQEAAQAQVDPLRPSRPSWAGEPERWGLAAAGFLIGVVALGFGAVPLLLAAAGYFGPEMAFQWRQKENMRKVDEDMPDLLATLSANARLSGDLAGLLHAAARDLTAKGDRPLAWLIGQTAARARSAGAEEALRWLERESPSLALKSLAFRLRVYAKMGGAFAETLEESSRRQRRRLEGIARAQAKAGGANGLANMLIGFALLAVVFVAFFNGQGKAFYSTFWGQVSIVIIVGMMVAGRFVIQNMVDDIR